MENNVKHGMDENEGIGIFVQCKETYRKDHAGIQISVKDNGCGFSAAVLSAINDSAADLSEPGFGLQNISAVLGLI